MRGLTRPAARTLRHERGRDADKFAAAKDAMLAELEKMKNELVTAEELTKAVKQFTAAMLSSRKTMSGQAQSRRQLIAASDLNFSKLTSTP